MSFESEARIFRIDILDLIYPFRMRHEKNNVLQVLLGDVEKSSLKNYRIASHIYDWNNIQVRNLFVGNRDTFTPLGVPFCPFSPLFGVVCAHR